MIVNKFASVLFVILFIQIPFLSFSQTDNSISVTVNGIGKDKEEANNNALRKAVLQTFNSFITSKTEIRNDSIVNDELISISNGNIKGYQEVSVYNLDNGNVSVTLNVEITPSKIYSYFISKGYDVEINGNLFAQNILLKEINEKNESLVLANIFEVASSQIPKLFKYEIDVSQPKRVDENTYGIDVSIKVVSSDNSKIFFDWLESNLKSISINKNEIKEYQDLNLPYFKVHLVYGNGVSWIGDDITLRSKKSIDILNGIFGKMVSSFTELNIVNSNNSKLGKMQDKWSIENLNSQYYVYMLNKKSKVDKIEKKMNISDGVNSFFVIKSGKEIGTFKNTDLLNIDDLKKVNHYKMLND